MSKAKELLNIMDENITLNFKNVSYNDMRDIELIVSKNKFYFPDVNKEGHRVVLVNDHEANLLKDLLKEKFPKLTSKRLSNTQIEIYLS